MESYCHLNFFRDEVIKRERAMRRAAEKRELPNVNDDSKFIDMYPASLPSVQEELKNRLDPATQRANLLKGRSMVNLGYK